MTTSQTSSASSESQSPPSHADKTVETYLASKMMKEVLQHSVDFTGHLEAIALRDLQRLPASSLHAATLASHVARAVNEWIEDWPSSELVPDTTRHDHE